MAKKPIVLSMSKESGGAPYEDLVTNKWRSSQIVCVQMVGFEDETSALSQVRYGIKQGNRYYWVNSVLNVEQGRVYGFYDPIWFSGDYQFVCRFIGSVAGDNLKAWLFGYLVEE